jgi:hypothetical protein
MLTLEWHEGAKCGRRGGEVTECPYQKGSCAPWMVTDQDRWVNGFYQGRCQYLDILTKQISDYADSFESDYNTALGILKEVREVRNYHHEKDTQWAELDEVLNKKRAWRGVPGTVTHMLKEVKNVFDRNSHEAGPQGSEIV